MSRLTQSMAFENAQIASVEGNGQKHEELAAKFQDFVAGTFYGQMLKSLRSTVGKPAYLHGGSAEELFQSQMDQTVAEQLASEHGGPMARSLYEVFESRLKAQGIIESSSENSPQSSPSSEPSRPARLSQQLTSAPSTTEVIGPLYRK